MRRFFVALALGSCTLLLGCGDDSEPMSSADKVLPTDPTPANFSEWEERWDGERWNVALKALDAREHDLRGSFARSFAREAESHGAFSLDAAGLMGSVQRLPTLSFGPTSSRKLRASFGIGGATATGAPCDFRSCPNFAFMRLRYERFPWQRLFGPALMDTLDISHSKRRGTFQLLWDTLRGMDEVWFAEPDLAAPSADLPASKNASPPKKPTFNATTPEGTPLEHIKTTHVREAEIYEKEKGYTLRDVVVAVLDTGVDRAHPRLQDKMFKLPLANVGEKPGPVILSGTEYYGDAYGIDSSWEPGQPDAVTKVSPGSTDVGGPGQACPDRKANAGTACLHGTHVAGIIAASEGIEDETKINVRGVCRNCKILALRAADTVPGTTPDNGPIRESSQIRAMQFVYNLQKGDGQLYVNVLNMSIGQPTSSRGMRGVIESLASTGIVLVGAASNYNTNRLAFPAAYDGVMAVCATSIREGVAPPGIQPRGTYAKAVFSNFGEWVDICAPGQDIRSTVPGGNFKYESGTSMAAPIVAGAAGYLMGLAQNLNIQGNGGAVIKRLQRYSNWGALYGAAARNDAYQFLLPDKTGVEFLGRGFLDVANALSQAREDTRIAPPVPQIERGCIASSIGAQNPRALYDFFTGLPFVPAAFAFVLFLARRLRSGLRR